MTGSRSNRTPRPSCTRSTTCSAISTRPTCTTLRAKGGLQSYPSRLKDPDTGRLLDRLRRHRRHRCALGCDGPPLRALPLPEHAADAGRFISLLGDAELDEGAIWEAVADPAVAAAGRAALDRRPQPAVPGPGRPRCPDPPADGHVRGCRLAGHHAEVGPPHHRALRAAPVATSCATDSRLCRTRSTSGCCGSLRRPGPPIGSWPAGRTAGAARASSLASSGAELADRLRDLGGHDIGLLRRHLPHCRRPPTDRGLRLHVKGRGLPTEGHPNNHSALLTGTR